MASQIQTNSFVIFDKPKLDNIDDNAPEPDHLNEISKHIDSLSNSLRALSLDIHDHPELQYKEFHAHHVLTEHLEKEAGWSVTPSAYGIDTAFVAVCDSGKKGPTVSFNAEYGKLRQM